MARRNGNATRGGVSAPRKSIGAKGAARREKFLSREELDLEALAKSLGVGYR